MVLARHLVREENTGCDSNDTVQANFTGRHSDLVKHFSERGGGVGLGQPRSRDVVRQHHIRGDDDIGEHSPCPPLSEGKEKENYGRKMSVPTGQSIAVSTRSLRRNRTP